MVDFVNRSVESFGAERARGAGAAWWWCTAGGGWANRGCSPVARELRRAVCACIEGSPPMQMEQLRRDLREGASAEGPELTPRTWVEFFELLRLEGPRAVCIDEFPYLVMADPSRSRVVQRFVDHRMPKGMTLILAGSRHAHDA